MKSKNEEKVLNFFLKIPPRLREILLIIFIVINRFTNIIKNISKTNKVLKEFKKTNPSVYQTAKRALWNYCFRQPSAEKCEIYLEAYKNQNIKCIKSNIASDLPYNEPIFICAVKNDLYRVKMQIHHHRALGINNFVYIDNMSDDGTFEWLLQQNVDVYRVDDKFSATAKNAWFRQITDIFGYNRWYLMLDSDELLVYPGMETGTIHDLIQFAESENIDFIQSFMIDMYSKEKINSRLTKDFDMNNYDIKKMNCYFDSNSYFTKPSYKGKRIVGGPRYRVFSDKEESFTPLLTKNSLVFLRKENVSGLHYSIPYYKNFNNPLITGLLHYKFLPNDKQKYVKIAKEGRYAGGSAEYKQYVKVIKKNPDLNFYYENSRKFTNSFDLMQINIIDKTYSNRLIRYMAQK